MQEREDIQIAYHGYIPLIKQHLAKIESPVSILEVGVDRGVTLISLLAFLARTKEKFMLLGLDVLVQEQVTLVVQNLDLQPTQQCYLLTGNSLNVLPDMVERKMSFDVVLIDGDHNYHTVSKELNCLDSLVKHGGFALIDDYEGRWADKDLWYSERPGYESIDCASKRIDTDKHGVKSAVDDFLESNKRWVSSRPIVGEPVLLSRRNIS